MAKRIDIEKAMRMTLDNARRFYKDSTILGKEGSIGHATSLAILGFEEAHKAYLLSNFLPIFDEIHTVEYRVQLELQLRDHAWKQLYAKEFRIGLEALLKSQALDDESRELIGLADVSELEDGTTLAFSEKLNDLKNQGFYSDAFSSPIWNPADIEKSTLKAVLGLLKSHIISVETTIYWLSRLNTIPSMFVKPVKQEMMELVSILRDSKSVDELKVKLKEYGEIGEQVISIADKKQFDPRIKSISKEKRR